MCRKRPVGIFTKCPHLNDYKHYLNYLCWAFFMVNLAWGLVREQMLVLLWKGLCDSNLRQILKGVIRISECVHNFSFYSLILWSKKYVKNYLFCNNNYVLVGSLLMLKPIPRQTSKLQFFQNFMANKVLQIKGISFQSTLISKKKTTAIFSW